MKWNREAAAFTKLFRWDRVSPLPVDVSRREDRAAHAVSSRVSWLTPRTWAHLAAQHHIPVARIVEILADLVGIEVSPAG